MRHTFRKGARRRQSSAAAWFVQIAFEGVKNGILLGDQVIRGASREGLDCEARICRSLGGKHGPIHNEEIGNVPGTAELIADASIWSGAPARAADQMPAARTAAASRGGLVC
jgi:hypothetical protein